MERQSESRLQRAELSGEPGEELHPRCYEIPATMPCPEYGESVPPSFVQFID
jgi:hypothetical protein